MVRTIIADDHALVRAGLRRVLEMTTAIEVIGEAETGREAIARVYEMDADVLVLDLKMPDGDGFEVITHLRSSRTRTKIIVTTAQSDEHHIRFARDAGADGYITKSSTATEWTEAILAVARGEARWPEESSPSPTPLRDLSSRELQVLTLLARGHRNSEIAGDLCIAARTVDTHRLNILRKLRLRNNADLVRYALRHNLIEA